MTRSILRKFPAYIANAMWDTRSAPKNSQHTWQVPFVYAVRLASLASINPGNDLAELIQREGVGRVCTDHSVETLQHLAVELADEITSDKNVSTRCRALPAKLFSPEAAVKQIAAALDG